MRRRIVLVCLAAGCLTIGACRGNTRIVYCVWCKYVVVVWENWWVVKMNCLVNYTYVILWVEDVVLGTEVRVGVLGDKLVM